MALGLLPGMVLKLIRKAPLGDPLAIEFGGQVVSLRLAEAENLIVDVSADCPIQRPRQPCASQKQACWSRSSATPTPASRPFSTP